MFFRSVRQFCKNVSSVQNEIQKIVSGNKIALFMKGTPDAPQCGFSRAVSQVLQVHGVRDFAVVDVMQHPDIRQGIKDFSNWPTIPQLFIDGKLVGGCDILLEMHQNGDLIKELAKVGVKSELAPSSSTDSTTSTTS